MKMIKRYNIIKKLLPALIVGLAFVGCDKPSPASLFDEDYVPKPAPVISSVTPENGYFAGFEEIVITGSNFTANTSELFVYFNERRATILSASPTQIVVRTPNFVADSIGIKVSVLGVAAFSNSWRYRLEALFSDVVEFAGNQNPWVATRGSNGTFYVSLEESGSPAGVNTYDADGALLAAGYATAQSWFYRSGKVGPDGGLYLVRGGAVPFVYRVPPGGGAAVTWGTGIGRTEDVVFDPSGNAWTAGTNENNASNSRLNRISPTRVITRFPLNAQVYALAYFNNHIYLAGTRGSDSFIWRVELLADLIPGEEQEVINLTAAGAALATSRPTALAIAGDGTLYVGMSGDVPLYQVSPAGQATVMYPGILQGNILKMEYIPNSQNILMTILPPTGSNRVITLNVQRDAP
jgi:hypothetical protein